MMAATISKVTQLRKVLEAASTRIGLSLCFIILLSVCRLKNKKGGPRNETDLVVVRFIAC